MYYIGVDLGTSSLKLLLMDEKGKIQNIVSKEYNLYFPKEGWAEQNPQDWWRAFETGILELLEDYDAKEVEGISFGGQMHGLVMLNEENQVIRRSIIWCDQRATKQVEEMLELPMEKWMKITANPPMAGWTAAKILWIRENEPELFARIQQKVKEGKWHIMGGWYLQPDCNMPNGESIIRNISRWGGMAG